MSAALAFAAAGAALLGLGLTPERVLRAAGDSALASGDGLAEGVLLARVVAFALAATLAAAAAWARRQADPAHAPRAALDARTGAALAGLVGLALGLRLVNLGEGLWYDEIVTWVEFVRLPFGALVTTYTAPNNHILYSLSAKLAMLALGEGPAALRLPAALFGAAGVAALFVFARRVVGVREALVAAALLAVSYHHVWFSQNARGYTGLLLFTLLGSALFLDLMRTGRPGRATPLAYAGCLAAALYVHLSGVFAFAVHGLLWLALLALSPTRLGPALRARWPGAFTPAPLLAFALGGLLALQLYALLVPQMLETFAAQAGSEAVVKVEAWTSPLWTALEVLRGLARLGPATLAVAGAAGLVGALGGWRLLRRDPLAAALMALPAPVTLTALLAIHFHVWPRYFFALLGFALVCGVHGLFELARAAARRAGRPARLGETAGAALAAAGVLGSLLLLPAALVHPKQAYATARDFIESRRGPGDTVVTAGLATYPYQKLYAPGWEAVTRAEELAALGGAPGRTWLVVSFPAYMAEAHPDVLAYADRRMERVRVFPGTLGGGEIEVWRSRDDGPRGGRIEKEERS